MDLDSYIAKYTGQTRLQRLLLVARTTLDDALASQAYRMAEQQMKAERNVKSYKEIFGKSLSDQQQQQKQQQGQGQGQSAHEEREAPSAVSPQEQQQQELDDMDMTLSQQPTLRQPSIPFDPEWVVVTETAIRNDRQVLQSRLSTAQSHLHKDAIRNAYIALALHDIKTGELDDALALLIRTTTDYCTSRAQTAQLCLLILELCLALQHFSHVRHYVNTMEYTLNGIQNENLTQEAFQELQDVAIKLKIAHGLERLANQDYEGAAQILIPLVMTTNTSASKMDWPGVASAEDIALYASFLSIATQTHSEIRELAEHPEALELVPAMKDLLAQWSRANYVKCMEVFSNTGSNNNSLIPEGDLYLTGSRWTTMSNKITEKCLLEYIRPYQSVRLDTMMQLFPSIHNLEEKLVDLMGHGYIPNAKIDARVNVLYKFPPKPTLDLPNIERRVLDDAHAMLIRLACLEHDFTVRDLVAVTRRGQGAASSVAPRLNNNRDDDGDDDDDTSENEGDTPMLDVDTVINLAENPEDLY